MTLRLDAAAALVMCLAIACGGQSKSDAKSEAGQSDAVPGTESTSGAPTASTGGAATGGTGGATTGGTGGAMTGGTGGATTGDTGVCQEPPIGATNPASCTDFEPSVGSECSEAGLVCDFDYCVFPFYGPYHQLTCTDGSWERTIEQECQPPTCPDLPPVVGEACDETLSPGPCEIVNACEDSLPAYCRAGVWETDCREIEPSEPPNPLLDSNCPVYPPTLGSACCPRWYAPTCDFSEFLENGNNDAAVGAATGSTVSGGGWMPTGPIAACVSCNSDSFVWEASDACE